MRRGASVGSGGRGNLREEPRRPRPYSRHCGALPLTIIYARRHQWERRRRKTTRHAASLRPPRNGGIGFKPPYSKGEPSQKPRTDSIFYGEGFPPLAMKNVSIKHLQLFEDRSDAACRVVLKTIKSPRWEACGVGMVCANGGGGARMRIWGKGVCSDAARHVAIRRCVVLALQDTVSRLELPACPWCYPKRSFCRTAIVPHFFVTFAAN